MNRNINSTSNRKPIKAWFFLKCFVKFMIYSMWC